MTSDKSPTVVIIEDDEDVRASTRALLEAMEYTVWEFQDAEGYLKKTESVQAGCIVLDYNLPGMSGMDLVDTLRRDGVYTPAIIVSANGSSLASRAAKLGIAAVLQKPLAADALSRLLRQILSKSAK